MTAVSAELWITAGIIVALIFLALLTVTTWWRRRRIERWRNMDQLNSVHNSRERRMRGD